MDFFFNKDNKNDIVDIVFFGKVPRWVACIADWIMLSVAIIFLAMQFMLNGWIGLIGGCIAFIVGFSLAKWVF